MTTKEKKESLLDRRCKILRDGIRPEAMQVLEEMVHMDLPVFQHLDEVDVKKAVLLAAVRDGEKGFVLKIKKMRAMAGGGYHEDSPNKP